MQIDEKALKPCPFCGGKARMIGGPFSQECYSVWCTATGCNTRVMGTMSAEATVEKWNRRSFSTITPAEVGGMVREYVEEYEFRFDDGGGYTPTEPERAMLEDFGNGLLSTALEAQAAELAALHEAINRVLKPAPGTRKPEPWVYGILGAAIKGGGHG